MSKFLQTKLTTSPHFKRKLDVITIMKNVVFALLPIVAYAIYIFGITALFVISTTTLTCVITEKTYNKLSGRKDTTRDYSAIITGLLLGLTLPPGFPLWMAVIGGIIAILMGKMMFGGLGFNVFNPALVGRAFLQTAFPSSITQWVDAFQTDRFEQVPSTVFTLPFFKPIVDGVSGATPLASMKFDHISTEKIDLFLGNVSGSVGETSALIIFLCGLYLALRRMLDWRIPVGILGSTYLLSGFIYLLDSEMPSPAFMIFSGGLMLGAIFMATDMVSSPVTPFAVWIYAIFIGSVVVVIRIWGGLPEGVMYVILLGNAITPLFNHAFKPRVYGTGVSRE